MKKNKIISVIAIVCLILSFNINCFAMEFSDVSSKDNINLLSGYENVTSTDLSLIGKNEETIDNEFEVSGTTSATLVVKEDDDSVFTKQNIAFSTLIAVCDAILFYFIYKVVSYFVANSKYKKAIAEGKEVEKPKIKIKLKYIVLLILVLDLVIWSGIFIINM